jgi:phospholipid transport system transporter-binding protein
MIRRDGERMLVSGALNLASVAAELEEGKAAIAAGACSVDLSGVQELDSSALALLLAWEREAKRLGRDLAFANLPQGLTTIARLYGVAELLPAAPASAHH